VVSVFVRSFVLAMPKSDGGSTRMFGISAPLRVGDDVVLDLVQVRR
jgi:hypothetical protein